MNRKAYAASPLALVWALIGFQTPAAASASVVPARPQGPCDIYAAAGTPCVAAHSSTRALFASYDGPLYRVMRQSDGASLDIGVVRPGTTSATDSGGYADAAKQDAFCAQTYCWITILYDQSGHKNDLVQPPHGGFNGPAMGGFNNLPIADMAPVTIMGHKVYGVYIAPGMGLRLNDAKGTAVDDQAEGQYWVINGRHFNSGCCFDYGNAEIDSRDDDNGTMETTYFGDATPWYHGNPPGPWVMTDQENNLVGCVNPDGSKLCSNLPNVSWRFVTAMAKGEPHHWTSLGGDAQKGSLQVMFDGPRIDSTYDPMRKQGAILLGNGGDNSNGSQGTFYEGAMTAAGTFPSNETDQRVHANVVAARYDVPRLSVASPSTVDAPAGLRTVSPGSQQSVLVAFVNTTGAPLTRLTLGLALPDKGWTAVVQGTGAPTKTFGQLAPGARVSAVFNVKSGEKSFNGDLIAQARWTDRNRRAGLDRAVEKVRNVSPVKVNEFRVTDGSAANTTNSFIELFNAGNAAVDLSSWTVTEHGSQEAVFSTVTVPAGTRIAPHGFYLLGLSNSGLAAPATSGDTVISVRSTDGIKPGDTIEIGSGADREIRRVASVGAPAGKVTTLWQPLPEGPVITIPAGSTNVPVASVDGFVVGQKIALGYGATYPAVGRDRERYEIATVTAVGKPGTQAYLGADAAAGASTIKVTSVENISPGDKIRLDIDSVGHGIETITVKSVGTRAYHAPLAMDAPAGATTIRVFRADGFTPGHTIDVGTPGNREQVTVTEIGAAGQPGVTLTVSPALKRAHKREEAVIDQGSGLELTAPLKFSHAANLPFDVWGAGVSFTPATVHPHSSNEPVQPLGTGITLDAPLAKAHPIHDVVRDAGVRTAGYQDGPAPDQWFGGPALAATAGSIVLRDGRGLVVDSVNYGGLVDPWASEGYQGRSGAEEAGCIVPAPGILGGWPPVTVVSTNSSGGRFPDGQDTDSNCTDFRVQSATTLPTGAAAGATSLKVAAVAGFAPGQTLTVGTGADRETVVVTQVGTPGATTASAAVDAGARMIPVRNGRGFAAGQVITIDDGAETETAVVASTLYGARIMLEEPLRHNHGAGASVSGSGLTLRAPLAHMHPTGTQIASDAPTPGAPNRYSAR